MLSPCGLLEKWVNPIYVEEFFNGGLALRRSELPFKHCVLRDFLKPEAIEQVLKYTSQATLERSHRKGLAAKADWYWGAFAHLDYLRFFLSPEMRNFFNKLMGLELVMKKGAIPQHNEFRAGSAGIGVHTDQSENVGVVSIFQLSQGYEPGGGGELILHRRQGQKIVPDRVIQPLCNTLILFQVGPESFHSVVDMQGEWTRRTITYDWQVSSRSLYQDFILETSQLE